MFSLFLIPLCYNSRLSNFSLLCLIVEEVHAGFQYREEVSHHNNGNMDQQSPLPPPIPPHDYDSIEILLHANESGFGFAITGGAEEGNQVSAHFWKLRAFFTFTTQKYD